MNTIPNIDNTTITDVVERIEQLIVDARVHVVRSVNITEVITKYEIGRIIIEVVQDGEERAAYSKLLHDVSDLLTKKLGKGWYVETLKICRRFYHIYSVNQVRYTQHSHLFTEDSVDSVYQIQTLEKACSLSSKQEYTAKQTARVDRRTRINRKLCLN